MSVPLPPTVVDVQLHFCVAYCHKRKKACSPGYTPHCLRNTCFVECCEGNHLLLNTSKIRDVVTDFHRTSTTHTPVNIQGSDIKIMDSNTWVFPSTTNWTDPTTLTPCTGRARVVCTWLRRLRSFSASRTLLRTFYDTVVASAVVYFIVCWGEASLAGTVRDLSWLRELAMSWAAAWTQLKR